MSHIGDMHAARPGQLRSLLLDHLSPAITELLTCKLEEYAEQGEGETHTPPKAVLPQQAC